MFQIETERLIIREWRDGDMAPFAQLNADARVMAHFPAVLSRDESDLVVLKICDIFRKYGHTFYAVEEKRTGEFIGMTGIVPVLFEAEFAPAVEIGWRMRFESWGRGYAPEAARRVLEYARDDLGMDEIVSFTPERNVNSRRVMEKIGMVRDLGGDFDYPKFPQGHVLAKFVLYRWG